MQSPSPNRKRSPGTSIDESKSVNQTQAKVPKRQVISELYTSINGIYNFSTTDVNFIFDLNGQVEQLIPLHRCILAAKSYVFRRMFYGENFKQKTGDVTIVDVTIQEFVLFIRSFY